MRRCLDVLVASLILLMTAPLLASIALGIFIESGRPLLYRRHCVGMNGRTFWMLRFRTMSDAPCHRTPDERLTPVGRFIQNYSLDEFPLLFNVVRGDMSIVGPRPTEVAVVDLADPSWQKILTVRPGMVSYATLNLARNFNASTQPTRTRLELEYVGRRSFRFDLQVFRRAIAALIASRGNVKARGEPTISE